MNPFTSVAEEGRSVFMYPTWHQMDRFENNVNVTYHNPGPQKGLVWGPVYVGKFGETTSFPSLPLPLQTVEMAALVGATMTFPSVPTEICGSRGEVANDGSFGNRFHTSGGRGSGAWGVDQPEQETTFATFRGQEMTWTS